MAWLRSFFALFLLQSFQSCVDHDSPAEMVDCASADEISYATEVKPIIDSKCNIVGDGGCHNGNNGASRDWRVFSNVQDHAAEIKDRITRSSGDPGKMPKIGSLTEAEIRSIVCWVEQGAQNN